MDLRCPGIHTKMNRSPKSFEGLLRFWFDDEEDHPIDLLPGEVIVIPGNRRHKALMIGKVIETDTFAPPRQDWIDGSDSYLRK